MLRSVLLRAAIVVLLGLAVWSLFQTGGLSQAINAVLGSGLAYALWRVQRTEERRAALESQLSERKRDLYTQYVGWVRKLTAHVKAGSPKVQQQKLADELSDISFRSMLVSSDRVMSRILDTRIDAHKGVLLAVMGDVLLEMRRDAGHPDTELTGTQLLRVFVNEDALPDLDAQREKWEQIKVERGER